MTEAIDWGEVDGPRPAVGMLSNNAGKVECTATLLPEKLRGGLPTRTSSIVLTAAHCRDNNKAVINRAFNVGTDSSNFVRYPVDAISVSFRHDLMMLHLQTPVELPPTGMNSPSYTYAFDTSGALPAVGTHCTATGFGYHHALDDTNAGCAASKDCVNGVRYAAEVAVAQHSGTSDVRIMTTGITGQTDHGDSGGPLLCGGLIAGVLSSGPYWKFDISAQVSYTPVYADWIELNRDLVPPTVQNSLYMVHRNNLYRTDDRLGNYQVVSQGAWANTTALTALDGNLYAVRDSWLLKVDPATGASTQLGSQLWSDTSAMTSMNGSLFIIQGSKLWKVNPATGARTRVGTWTWPTTTSMVGFVRSDGVALLWIVSAERLWWLDVNTLASGHSGFDFYGPTQMTQVENTPYVFQDNAIWRIDNRFPIQWTRIGNEDWTGTTALASLNGTLLPINARYLRRLPLDGSPSEPLQHGDWPAAEAPDETAVLMTALP